MKEGGHPMQSQPGLGLRAGLAADGGRLLSAEARAAAQSRIRWELFVNLVRKDLKVKYKGSTLGFVWSLANPLLYLAVFSLVFQVILPSRVPNFAAYFMAGLLIWNFFSTATLSATGSVVGAANLVKKVPFPRLVLPFATVGFVGVQTLLQFGVFTLFLLAFYRDFLGPQLVLAVPAVLVAVLLTSAVSVLVSSVNVRWRDVQHLWEMAMIAGFWLTPIVYPLTLVRDQLGGLFRLYLLNPMVPVVAALQRAIYVHPNPPDAAGVPQPVLVDGGYAFYLKWLGVSGLTAVVLLGLALVVFRRLDGSFAEEL
jgi:ABC-2 type transport system permease protein